MALEKWEKRVADLMAAEPIFKPPVTYDVTPLSDNATESNVKKVVLRAIQQADGMLQDMIRRGITFKSLEAGMAVLAKLVEINTKLSDDGDAASRKIEIKITGTYGQDKPLPQADVAQIEDGSIEDAAFIELLESPVPTDHEEQRKPLDSFEIGQEPTEPTS